MSAPTRVTFVFASRAIGGAERSMLRLIEQTHPGRLACRILLVAPENPELRQAAGALGVPFDRVSATNLPGLWRALRRRRPDVLYVFGRFRTIPWALVARLAGVPHVVAAERSAANRASDRWARRLDRRLVDAYVANSEFAAERVRAAVGPGGPPVHVVPNGLTGHEPAARVAVDVPPAIVCIGNISANKGQGVLLEAVRVLRERHPGVRAVLVGRDFTKGRFFAQADARGLADTYEATGFAADVGPYLARATVVALPTLGREGMPTSLLEAMRAGVPVVASNVGGVGEIVKHEHTGLLVEPGDATGLAAALGRLLDDADARSRLGAAGQRFVRERHDVSVMVEGHLAAFASVGRARPEPARVQVAHVTTADVSLRYLLLNQLHAIRDDGYAITGVSSHGPDVARLEQEGIEHVAVPMSRRLTPWRDLVSLVRLYRLMRRRRFTIVHTHNPKPGLLGQVAARLAGVPVVVNTLHGFYFHDRMRPLARRFYVALEKLAARCSDVILSQNDEDVRTALELGIARPGRIRHLGNGIDVRRFDPARLTPEDRLRTRTELGIAADAPVVGFVGRLVAEKGVPELLAAARLVADAIPSVRFLLIGGTDVEKADALSPRIADEMGVGAVCVFAGVREDMPELYHAMDVFALPSHREGFPRAPLEASAMAVPCVVTDVRGCRQAVAHERNGVLVPPGDAPALARAILDLLRDPAHARRLGDDGRRRALELFDERLVFTRVLAEYARLLRDKGVRGDEEPVRSGPAVPPASAGDVRSTAAALELMTTARGDEEPVRSGPAVPPARAGDVRITAAALELMTTARGDEEPVRFGPAVPPARAGDARISPAGGEGHAPRERRLARLVKRAIDVSAAAIGLVACAPVLAAVAIAVRVTMGRPVLFRQQRPGLHGRPFALVKFRTMRDGHGPDGERLTRLGRFLRACSLDELPELWNVLRGDMSLVGPRPLLMHYLDRYTPEQARRHLVRPGITGWAQVHGRNAVGWDERLALDAWYVDHWSPGLDLRILARTFAIVVARQGIQADGSDTMPEFQGSEVRS